MTANSTHSVCFATAWRTYHVVKFSTPQAKMNFTVTVVEDDLWSGIEITLGIIKACLPVMHPALQKILGGPFLRLLSLTTWRGTKASKMSSATGDSSRYGRGPSWRRLDNSNSNSSSTSKQHGITTEYTIDIEAASCHGSTCENVMELGPTTWVNENEPKR